MRISTLVVIAVGIAAGAAAVLIVQNLRGTEGDPPAAADASGSDPSVLQRNGQPSQLNPPVVNPVASTPLPIEQPPHSTEPTTSVGASTWCQEFQRSSAEYAQSFQPGVWGMEPIPEFAARVFQRDGPGSDVISRHEQHVADPKDGWSAEMETRLRNFFEAQEEISKSRVAVDCRSTGCELQMTDGPLSPEERRARAGLGSLSTSMLGRLREEDWFAQNLSNPGGRSTPRGDAVSFYLMFLPRRESPN